MKRFDNTKRLVDFLEWRREILCGHADRYRNVLASLEMRIVEQDAAIEQLHERLNAIIAAKPYERSELMRVRGKQGALRLEIACARAELHELHERRQAAERTVYEGQNAMLVLALRQRKHLDWLRRCQHEAKLRWESTADEDTTEGAVHGFNCRC